MYAMARSIAEAFAVEPPPEVEINSAHKVECTSLLCGWYDYADDESHAHALRNMHQDWHEDGCPRI